MVESSIHSCWLGTYEPDKQEIIKSFVKPGMTVFDIGAHAGFYTLAFSGLVGEAGSVFAFEPFAENAKNILKHISVNAVTNATLFQVAVSDQDGVVGFRVADSSYMGAISTDGNYRVPSVSIDRLIQQGLTPLPDLIKIDVEGAEALVLRGAKDAFKQKKPILVIALHGEAAQEACMRFLIDSGFAAFKLDGSRVDKLLPGESEIYALPVERADG